MRDKVEEYIEQATSPDILNVYEPIDFIPGSPQTFRTFLLGSTTLGSGKEPKVSSGVKRYVECLIKLLSQQVKIFRSLKFYLSSSIYFQGCEQRSLGHVPAEVPGCGPGGPGGGDDPQPDRRQPPASRREGPKRSR